MRALDGRHPHPRPSSRSALTTLWAAAPASAKVRPTRCATARSTMGGFNVKLPARRTSRVPNVNGNIVGMHARLVDARGRRITIRDVMLHHIVFHRTAQTGRPRRRARAGTAEPFYGTGEENQSLRLPRGLRLPDARDGPLADDLDADEPQRPLHGRLHPVPRQDRHQLAADAGARVLGARQRLLARDRLRRRRRRRARLDRHAHVRLEGRRSAGASSPPAATCTAARRTCGCPSRAAATAGCSTPRPRTRMPGPPRLPRPPDPARARADRHALVLLAHRGSRSGAGEVAAPQRRLRRRRCRTP